MNSVLVKLHVVQPGSSLNKLHFHLWRNVVCKTTAKKKKSSFMTYLCSLYSSNSVLNKSTYGVYETKYNSLQTIHIPAEICLFNSSFILWRTKADICGRRHRNTEALELDARAEPLVDTTHEQFLKVCIRQPVLFGTENIFTNSKKPLIWALPSLAQRLIHSVKQLRAARASQSQAGYDMFHAYFKEKNKNV